jgi:hypothetical protein
MGDTTDFDRTDRPATAQPAPVHVPGEPSVHDLLIGHIRERAAFGLRKYGTPLQVGNGRDPLADALEELLDAAAYVCQAIAQRDRQRALQTAQPVHTVPSAEYLITRTFSG